MPSIQFYLATAADDDTSKKIAELLNLPVEGSEPLTVETYLDELALVHVPSDWFNAEPGHPTEVDISRLGELLEDLAQAGADTDALKEVGGKLKMITKRHASDALRIRIV